MTSFDHNVVHFNFPKISALPFLLYDGLAGVRRDKTLTECCALIPGHENGFERASVDIRSDVFDYLAHRRGEDAAGLAAMTPWLKLYPAGILYP